MKLLVSRRAIISSPIAKWNLPYEGMIRRPARSHPRYRPFLRRAPTRRVSPVCLTSTRMCVRVRECACSRNSCVHSVSKAPLSMLRSVMHGLAWSACFCHYTRIFDFVSPTKTMMITIMMMSHSTVVEHRQSPTAGRRAPKPLTDVPRARARHL